MNLIPPVLNDYTGSSRDAFTPDIGAIESPFSAPTQGYVVIDYPGVIQEGMPMQMSASLSPSLQSLVDGGASLTWQWRLDGTNISGETESIYIVSLVDASSQGNYSVVATVDGNSYISGDYLLLVRGIIGDDPTGEATPPTQSMTLMPKHMDFGLVPVNGTEMEVVLIQNTTAYTQTGTASVSAGPFEIAYGSSPWPYELPPGASVELSVRAVPTALGEFVGRIALTTGEELTLSCHTQTNDIEGAIIKVAPSILQFAHVTTSATRDIPVVVRNVGSTHLAGTVIATTPFSVVGDSTYILQPDGSTTMTLRFAPHTSGVFEGHAAFTGGGGKVISLYGTSEVGSTSITSGIRINELAPWNIGGLQLGDGSYPDWIELYNENPQAVDLAGWTLTDDPGNQTNYTGFPTGTVIDGFNYMLVYATTGASPHPGEIHTGFELDEINGGHVGLYNPSDTLESSVNFPAAPAQDRSYQYVEDSSKSFGSSNKVGGTGGYWDWGGADSTKIQ